MSSINVGDADTAPLAVSGGKTRRSPPPFAGSSGTAAASLALENRPVTRIRATFSSLPAWLGRGGRKRLHPQLRQVQLGRTPGPFHSAGCRPAHRLWRGQRRTSTPSRAPRCWCSGTRKCRRLPTTSARVVPCTSAVCLTVCQQPHPLPRYPVECPQRGGTAYMVQLQLQRGGARLRQKRQVLRGEQHVRAAGYHSLYDGCNSFDLQLDANEIRWYEI